MVAGIVTASPASAVCLTLIRFIGPDVTHWILRYASHEECEARVLGPFPDA